MGWIGKFLLSQKVLDYLKRLIDPTDNGASLRHAAFLVTILSGIVWLSVDMVIKEAGGGHRGIDGNWDTAFGLLLAAVTGAKVWGKNENRDPQGQGTQDQAGGNP